MYNIIFYEKTKDLTYEVAGGTKTITYRVPTKFVFNTATNCDYMFAGDNLMDDVNIDMISLNSAVSMFENSDITSVKSHEEIDEETGTTISIPANFSSLTIADSMFSNCPNLFSFIIY